MTPASPATTPALPTMREALDAVAGDLRRCAALDDGLLLLEFTVDKGAFAKVSAGGTTPDNVVACVGEATRSLRFQAVPLPETFTEEYMP